MLCLRRLTLLALVLWLTACGGGSGGSDSGSSSGGPGKGGGKTDMSAAEVALAFEVLDLVNAERAAQGLAPLQWHADAAQVAYLHCVDMDVRDFFSHTNPDGDGPGDRINAAEIQHSGWGENIAWGYGSPQSVMNGWMSSDGHRANILRTSWTHIGIGVHAPGTGGPWWGQVFLRLLAFLFHILRVCVWMKPCMT